MIYKTLISLFITAFSIQAFSLDVQTFSPLNSTQGGFNLYNADEFEEGRWTLGLHYNLDKHPLEFGLRDNTKVDDLVNDLHTANLIFSYEFSNRIALNLDLPYQYLSDFEGLSTPIRSQEQSFGDLLVTLPIYLGHITKRLRLKLIPKLVLNSGDDNPFVGESNLNYGLGVSVDRVSTRSRWVFNAEYQGREAQRLYNLEIGNAARVGLGYTRDIGKLGGFVWINEITGEIPLGLDQREINTPVEAFTGLRHFSKSEKFVWNVGYAKGLNHGYGAPDFRIFAGINYIFNNNTPEPVVEKKVLQAIPQPAAPKIIEKTVIVEKNLKPIVVYLPKIHFHTNSDRVKADSISVLDKVYQTLIKYPGIKVLKISGHTDSRGNLDYNMDLSKRRAKTVANYLMSRGISRQRLRAFGFGPTRAVDTNATSAGRYNNRRVEFSVLDAQGVNVIFKESR